jgi:hypothetical protein
MLFMFVVAGSENPLVKTKGTLGFAMTSSCAKNGNPASAIFEGSF